MDRIEIPAEQIIPMNAIADGVQGLRIGFVNVFSVAQPDGSWTLIDAGIPLSGTTIQSWAERSFSVPPSSILLTHGHFDHVGAAKELADHWGIPIYAHENEAPYLTGKEQYPPPDWKAGGGMMTLLSPIYPRKPIDLGSRLQLLKTDRERSSSPLNGWQLLHTPGHTPGHISLFRPADRVLLPGDAFCTTKPESFFEAAIKQDPELHGPPSYFTSDWKAARRSVQSLAELQATTVAPGHGKPLTGPLVATALSELAARFDDVAVPDDKKGSDTNQ